MHSLNILMGTKVAQVSADETTRLGLLSSSKTQYSNHKSCSFKQRLITKICDKLKCLNRHRSKSIRVTSLFFCQNDVLIGEPFWLKDSLVTLILFDLCLFQHFSLSQISLYVDSFYFCTPRLKTSQPVFPQCAKSKVGLASN